MEEIEAVLIYLKWEMKSKANFYNTWLREKSKKPGTLKEKCRETIKR